MAVMRYTGFVIRQGGSYARGTGIDPLLPENDVAIVYKKWLPTWPEPNEFQGGIKEITCEMVLDVPENELRKVYGKAFAKSLREVATINAGR